MNEFTELQKKPPMVKEDVCRIQKKTGLVLPISITFRTSL